MMRTAGTRSTGLEEPEAILRRQFGRSAELADKKEGSIRATVADLVSGLVSLRLRWM